MYTSPQNSKPLTKPKPASALFSLQQLLDWRASRCLDIWCCGACYLFIYLFILTEVFFLFSSLFPPVNPSPKGIRGRQKCVPSLPPPPSVHLPSIFISFFTINKTFCFKKNKKNKKNMPAEGLRGRQKRVLAHLPPVGNGCSPPPPLRLASSHLPIIYCFPIFFFNPFSTAFFFFFTN